MPQDTSAEITQLGTYDVLEKIAEGGMGIVYKARSRVTGEDVAIKVISPGPARNPVLLQRFEREFLAAKVLEHPNVVRAIEYCGTGPHPFLVMELVDGESVGQRIERDGAYAEADALHIISQVCDGLQRAHKQGLVHRDVKPDNILVNREGMAKLADMGLVKDAEADLNLTKTGRGLGTPHYMAPEQFRNAKGVDVRGDVYSLGATLYAMVTGEVPFNNSNPLDCWMKKIRNEFPPPKQINASVSDRVDWAIRRAMSAEPSQRPSSCREFLEDLTGQSRVNAPASSRNTPVPADVWYLVYKDETGQQHSVKGNTEAIRKALQDSLLGDTSAILVGRSKTGQFQSLQSVPEFRDLVVNPAALPLPGSGRISGTHARPNEAEANELGAGPDSSGRLTGRRTSMPAKSPSPRTRTPSPSPPQVIIPTPDPSLDPHAETTNYSPSARTAMPVRTPAEQPAARKPFDWTPVVMVLVALASAAVGYYLLTR